MLLLNWERLQFDSGTGYFSKMI